MNRWMMIAAAVLLAGLVGVMAYNAGIDRGIEQSGKLPAAAAPYPYYWHHHGYGGFFLLPLLFVAAMVVVFRGRHRHYACRHDHDPDRGR
jgi:hypothetical protein